MRLENTNMISKKYNEVEFIPAEKEQKLIPQ